MLAAAPTFDQPVLLMVVIGRTVAATLIGARTIVHAVPLPVVAGGGDSGDQTVPPTLVPLASAVRLCATPASLLPVVVALPVQCPATFVTPAAGVGPAVSRSVTTVLPEFAT